MPWITAAMEDSADRVWVASFHQLIYHDTRGMHDPGLPRFGLQKNTSIGMAAFPEDRNQFFLLADQMLFRVSSADGGVTWHREQVLSSAKIAEHKELASLNSLTAIGSQEGEPGSRTLWMACGSMLCAVSPDNGTTQLWGPKDGIPEDAWQVVHRDHLGNLWARGLHHLVRLPRGAARFVSEEGNLGTRLLDMREPSLVEDPGGRMLVNLNEGIARREGDTWHIFGTKNNLPPHIMANLLFDRQGGFLVLGGWARPAAMAGL